MNVAVIGVGKLRERFWRDAVDEYKKRLSRFGRVEEIELPDEPEPPDRSPALASRAMAREGEAILSRLREGDALVALCIDGERLDSVRFAKRLAELGEGGRRVVFAVGGSLGLSPAVVARAKVRLSFSPMTFPHQLARVMLFEQLYRACKIAAGERYHK